MKKGFTLLETLIALSVMTISLLGIYSLLNNAVFISENSEEKINLNQMAYERFLIKRHYPDKILPKIINNTDVTVEFKETRKPTILNRLFEIRLKAIADNNETELIYYEIK
jgi:prepilin-type N-terminal cleavage/methylation domain-containing protein